ncbi:MAG: 30S ribosomal protein THX [Lentimicrobium sp.]|nr:30S ribosomal protein THX [Lentimicrobium sp.]
MGKGDKKSKHGKIIMGSHGVRRPRRKKATKGIAPVADAKPEIAIVKSKVKESEPKPKAPKKTKTEEKPVIDVVADKVETPAAEE